MASGGRKNDSINITNCSLYSGNLLLRINSILLKETDAVIEIYDDLVVCRSCYGDYDFLPRTLSMFCTAVGN